MRLSPSAFGGFIESMGGTTAHQVANAHLVFNFTCATVFLLALRPFKAAIERLVPGKEEEILFHTKYLEDKIPKSNKQAFSLIEKELINSQYITIKLFEESSEFLKSGKNQRLNRVAKLEALNDYLDERIERSLFELSKRKLSKKDAERTVLLVRISNAIEQLGDRGEAFGYLTVDMSESGNSFSPESIVELEHIYGKFRENMELIKESLPAIPQKNVKSMRKNDVIFRNLMNESYQKHLERLYTQKAYAGSFFVEALSILEDANAHVREIRKLSELYAKLK